MISLSLRRPAASARPAVSLTRRVAKWIETRRTRSALARLDAHLLRDIGLPEDAALRESARPFWTE